MTLPAAPPTTPSRGATAPLPPADSVLPAIDRAAGTAPGLAPAVSPPHRRTALARLGDAVLQLHRGAREWPASRFEARAIEVLRDLLPFDALLWGSTRADAPPGTPLSPQGLHASGLHATTLEHGLRGLLPEGALSAWHVEPLAQRRVEVHLWRWSGSGTGFDAHDTEWLAVLLPQLVETQRQHRLSRAAQGDPDEAVRPRRHVLVCDGHAVVHQADEQALALLRVEWPRWRGGRLPEALAGAVAAGAGHDGASAAAARRPAPIDAAPAAPSAKPLLSAPATAVRPVFYGRHVTVQVGPSDPMGTVLDVRRRADSDRLSHRQRDVAQLYAQGLTGPQIAQQLGLKSSTVNNHLGVVFKKLSVRNKVQLLQAMHAGGMPAGG